MADEVKVEQKAPEVPAEKPKDVAVEKKAEEKKEVVANKNSPQENNLTGELDHSSFPPKVKK